MNNMETERLVIRRFVPDDWKDLYEYLSVPEVVQYEPYDVMDVDTCIQIAKNRSELDQCKKFWAVCLKSSNKMIGQIYFDIIGPKKFFTFELGYVFNPFYYGNGYATEVCRRILQYGFEELSAHRIIAETDVKNIASWRLLERLRMRREAHRKQDVFFKMNNTGECIWKDSYQYALLREEWETT